MPSAENCCRFTGKLMSFTTSKVGDGPYLLGKGDLVLPDHVFTNIGQIIKITAWEEVAEKLSSVPLGSWVTVVGSYMPNVFRNQLQDTFNITLAQVRNDT